jgi:hypothetical protein
MTALIWPLFLLQQFFIISVKLSFHGLAAKGKQIDGKIFSERTNNR